MLKPQIEYGQLLACVKMVATHESYCIVNKLLPVLSGTSDSPILNEMECPLVTMSSRYEVLESRKILGPISMVHQCDDSCGTSEPNWRENK